MESNSSLGLTLHHLSFMLDRQSDLFLRDRFGIGFSQFKILIALSHRANIQQQEIAEFLGQTQSSVSRQIQVMVTDGLVSSRREASDRRQRITQLTKKGDNLTKAATAELENHFAPMFKSLSEKRQKELAEMLDTMRDYVSNNVRFGYWTRARHNDG